MEVAVEVDGLAGGETAYVPLDDAPVDAATGAAGTRLVAVLRVIPISGGGGRLMVDDALPAGLEIDNPNLLRAHDIAALDWLKPVKPEHAEFRADRFLASTDLSEGAPLHIHTVADGHRRLAVDPTHVDPTYIAMLRPYEDRRFERHSGVDPLALLRAAAQALRHGRVVSGGSTLTMPVAREPEASGTGHWRGELRQMRVALALERRLDKRQILALYLTLAPFGGNLEGVRATSLAWFGKAPVGLTEAEAAFPADAAGRSAAVGLRLDAPAQR